MGRGWAEGRKEARSEAKTRRGRQEEEVKLAEGKEVGIFDRQSNESGQQLT